MSRFARFIAAAVLVSSVACGGGTTQENPTGPTAMPPPPSPSPSPTPTPTPTPTPGPSGEVQITTTEIPAGVLGQLGFCFQLTAEGGNDEYIWGVEGLPPELGFELRPSGGFCAPMIRRTGRYHLNFTVEDSAGRRGTKALFFTSATQPHETELLGSLGESTGVTVSDVLVKPERGVVIRASRLPNHNFRGDIPFGYFSQYCQSANLATWQDPENRCFIFRARVRNYTTTSVRFQLDASPLNNAAYLLSTNRNVLPGELLVDVPGAGFFTPFYGGERYLILSVPTGRMVMDRGWTSFQQ